MGAVHRVGMAVDDGCISAAKYRGNEGRTHQMGRNAVEPAAAVAVNLKYPTVCSTFGGLPLRN